MFKLIWILFSSITHLNSLSEIVNPKTKYLKSFFKSHHLGNCITIQILKAKYFNAIMQSYDILNSKFSM